MINGADRRPRAVPRRWLTAAAAMALLAGCGGGGGERDGTVAVVPGPQAASPSPAPSSPAVPTEQQLEDQRSNAALVANADAAYRGGWTGKGVKIAVIDTGITPDVTEFAGRIDPASADLDGTRGLMDGNGHGTWMASVALAARDARGMHGIAPEAILLSFNASRPDDCTVVRCPVYGSRVTAGIDAAVAAGARVISMSFTTNQVDDALLAAVRRAAAADVVLVIAAGNETASEPLLLSRAVAEAGGSHVIIAGAHDVAGQPYRFNNQAGDGPAAASYLMALGVDVTMTGRDGSLVVYSGTSPATAAISGAVALVAQARPRMTGAQIVALLLATGSDRGASGRDPIYGNGLLDLAAAFAALPPPS